MAHLFVRAVSMAGLLLVSLAPPAVAAVYAGCPEPVRNTEGHHFYVDPVKGSMSGDGSRAHPWRTLAEVEKNGLFATKPTPWAVATGGAVTINAGAPIQPGDTVYLLSGDHGEVTIQGFFGKTLVGYANPEFITIEAAPGETPVIRRLDMLGGSKWVFRGLTFQSVNDTGKFATSRAGIPDRALVELRGQHENIILDNDNFLSAPDVSQWTMADWQKLRLNGIHDTAGACIAITNNKMWNIGFGIQTQKSDFVLIKDNTIDHFSDDAIDYGSSHLLIEHNRITNSLEDGDGFHRDAMQGQAWNEEAIVENVVIRNNTVIRLLDPNLRWPAYLQGIDTFDGIWKNVTVSNNIVVTDALHGISYYGAHGIVIKNNILIGDSGKALLCPDAQIDECPVHPVLYDHRYVPAINIHQSKANSPSTDVVIENNITTGIGVNLTSDGAVIKNNLCVLTSGKCVLGFPMNGKMIWSGKPGVVGDHNVIAGFDASSLFAAYDPMTMTYDFHLKRSNPAVAR
jgi:hypothetical protein